MKVELGVLEQFVPFVHGQIKQPICLLSGGRGSGKSRATAQRLVLRSLSGKRRIGLVRKVFNSIRDSQWKEIRDVVEGLGLSHLFEFKVSPLSITVKSGSEFICKGLDETSKIKSIASLDEVWIEEGEELTHDDWTTLRLSVRGLSQKSISITFNPQSGHWLKDEFYRADGTPQERPDVYYMHSTYLNNKFVGDAFAAEMQRLKDKDGDLYRLHGLGEWVKPRGLIYTNWDVVSELPERKFVEFGGLDFGYFPDPAAFVKCYMSGDEIWLEEKLYENNLTNDQLSERLKELGEDFEFWADSAEPKSIQDMVNAGFYMCRPVEKGPDSVAHGIDLVQSKTLHIMENSTNLISEITSYVLKKDANGNYISGKPVDYKNHLMDALRYAIWGKCREPDLNIAFI